MQTYKNVCKNPCHPCYTMLYYEYQIGNLSEVVSMKRYTIRDFAKIVGVSEMTLHRWAKAGKLVPYRTLGGKPYYTDSHLQQVLGAR